MKNIFFSKCGLLVIGIYLTTMVKAQTTTNFQYWFDNNVAAATTLSTTNTASVSFSSALSTSTLSMGYHKITYRFKDSNGDYSVPVTATFVRTGFDIVAYEYWFDNNVAAATTVSTTNTTNINLSSALSTSALSIGYHKITYRFKDSNGDYSVPVTAAFVRSGFNITAYDYWWDNDYTNHTQVSIATPATTINLQTILASSGLSSGAHTFTIMFKDAQNSWSVPMQNSIQVFTAIQELTSVNSITIFPNPATTSAQLKFDGT